MATKDGIIGYIRSVAITDIGKETVASTLKERVYTHLLKEGKICLGWHQVTSQKGNDNLLEVIANISGMNVISPTWFYLDDNSGNIADLSDSEYVSVADRKSVV